MRSKVVTRAASSLSTRSQNVTQHGVAAWAELPLATGHLFTLSVAEVPGAGAAVTLSPRPLGSCRRPHPPFAEPGSLVPLQARTVCSDWEVGCSFSMPSPPLTLSAHPGGQGRSLFF